jgi:hypothetical protein
VEQEEGGEGEELTYEDAGASSTDGGSLLSEPALRCLAASLEYHCV